MKIVHVITGLSIGGAERALCNLLQGGLSTNFESYVISLMDEGVIGAQIEALGVPVISLGMKAGRPSLSSVIKLRKVISRVQPDLIQGWMYHGNLGASLAGLFCSGNVRVVWNIRQSLYQIETEKILTRFVIRINRFLSGLPSVLLYNSQLSREHHESFGFIGHKAQVIPNGINCQLFRFSERKRVRMRSELAIPTSAFVVGHVARFHPMKDHVTFLQAAVIVLESHPNAHFVLTGRDVCLGNEVLVRNIPVLLKDRFHFLGERRDVPELMCSMDILTSSSWAEAFPNVLGEAMALGLPCVATDVGDSGHIIGECGVLVAPKDKNALAEGMALLLEMPDEERRGLGEMSRRRIEDNFSLSMIVEQYTGLYKKAIFEQRQV